MKPSNKKATHRTSSVALASYDEWRFIVPASFFNGEFTWQNMFRAHTLRNTCADILYGAQSTMEPIVGGCFSF